MLIYYNSYINIYILYMDNWKTKKKISATRREYASMKARERETPATLTLSDKRLLSMDEFCVYSGLGVNVARNVARTTGALFRVGRRVLVDRVKFDRYCDENTEADAQ